VTNSIFEEPWWLEATAPGLWGSVEVKHEEETIGRLPYVIKKKFGLLALAQPPLTQSLGPWVSNSDAKYCNRISREHEILSSLIRLLPSHDLFSQSFNTAVTNWLPFYWNGFEQTTRYTYILDGLHDLGSVWNEMAANVRTHIRKAEKKLKIHTDPNVDLLYETNALTFKRQGLQPPYSKDYVKNLDSACARRDARRMFFAIDDRGRCHHAIYVVFDKRSAFNIMSGGDPELRSSGAASLLMWEAIKFAAQVSPRFDFEGSMLERVEPFVRAFGAKQVPYFYVRRRSRRLRLINCFQELKTIFVNYCRSHSDETASQ
jgi:hypothetical protein